MGGCNERMDDPEEDRREEEDRNRRRNEAWEKIKEVVTDWFSNHPGTTLTLDSQYDAGYNEYKISSQISEKAKRVASYRR